MISATTHDGRTSDGLTSTWVLRPNQSLTWRECKLVFAGILAVSLVIAISFAVLGFWPILPFAGAELAALGGALYLCQSRGRCVEVISVQGSRVAVEKGRNGPTQRWDFERAWVQVRLQRARVRGHPSRLILRSHGREVSIGDFLIEDERKLVAEALQRAVRNDGLDTSIVGATH